MHGNQPPSNVTQRYYYLTWLFSHGLSSLSTSFNQHIHTLAHSAWMWYCSSSHTQEISATAIQLREHGVSLCCSRTYAHTHRVDFYSRSTSFISMVLIIVFQHESADLRTFRFCFILIFFPFFRSSSIHTGSHTASIFSCKQCKITISRINKPIIVFQTLTNQYMMWCSFRAHNLTSNPLVFYPSA